MTPFSIQRKVGLTVITATFLFIAINFFNCLLFRDMSILRSLLHPSVSGLLGISALVLLISFIDQPALRIIQGLLFLILSGPILISGTSMTFFGFWFIIIAIVLLYKFGFYTRFAIIKLIAIFAWVFGWTAFFILREGFSSILSGIGVLVFLSSSLITLYFVFEENIKELTKANIAKDTELEVQRKKIAQMEPLSTIGERVSHVTHSFKNNLTQVSAALYYLDRGQADRAAEKLKSFNAAMVARIDNILLLARGAEAVAMEEIDVGNLLDGIKFLFLEDPVVAKHAKTEIDAPPGTIIMARKWDLVLLIENLLRNAVEAIVERGIMGTIEILLRPGYFRISSDGGTIGPCVGCSKPCLSCERFSRTGYTTKKGGSGQGLPQVFGAVKAAGWDIKVESSGVMTSFTVFFGPGAGASPAPVSPPPEKGCIKLVTEH